MGFPIRVYTLSYLLTGEVESQDAFLSWLNNPSKESLNLSEVEGLTLDPDAVLTSVTQREVVVPKHQVMAIDMMSPEAAAWVTMPPRAEMAVLYTPRFIIQAYVHPAGDMRVSNLFNVMSGLLFPTSHAQLHPIVPTRDLPTDYARLLIVNRSCVDFFHPKD